MKRPLPTAEWLTLPEFLAAAGMARSTFFHQQKRGLLVTKKTGRTLMIAAASLPADARAQLEAAANRSLSAAVGRRQTEARTELMRPPEPACAPAPLFAGVSTQGQGRRLALPPGHEAAALGRLTVLQPLIDFCSDATARSRYQLLQLADGSAVRTSNDMALYLAQTHSTTADKLSVSTLWRWKRRYESDGLVGLARKLREDKGVSKWATRWPAAAKLVAATYMQPCQTKQTAYDALERDRAMLGISEEELPSYGAVCEFLATLPAAPVVLAREGEKAHQARFATYLSRGYEDIEPNRVWVSDHAIHDVEVRNDCFIGVQENAPMRLQLTALMDLRTRMIVGATWTPVGNSRSIATALRQAIHKYGPCETFYCDNGKDYQKVGRFAVAANQNGEVDQEMQSIERAGALRMLGIKVQYCIKYHPQSKPIERMFRTMHLKLDAILPHYTTGNSYTRPDRINADGAAHRKLLRMDRAHLSPLMPASQFIAMTSLWLEQDYNQQHKHRGRGMGGRTPAEIFFASWSEETRRPFDPAALETLLWQREKRLVRNCAVTVANRRLIGATPSDVDVLYRAGDTEVLVCFDPNAPETGVMTTLEGVKLCNLKAESFVTQSAEAGPMIAASLQERRTHRNDSAASLRALRRDVAGAGHKTAAQHLHERAQAWRQEPFLLPMAVGDHITQRVVEQTPRAAAAPRYAHEVAMDVLNTLEEA